MGLNITVSNADYSALIDYDAKNYLDATGITNPVITSAVNIFIKKMKLNGLWSKIDHIYAALGTTYNQVKYNLKNPDSLVIPPFTNTLNKGFVLTSVGDTLTSGLINLPSIDRNFILALIASGGHSMYFINETLTPTSTTAVGVGIPLGWGVVTQSLFSLSGSMGLPNRKGFSLLNRIASTAPAYLTKGSFLAVKSVDTAKFYGNGALLASAAFGTSPNTFTGNVTIPDIKYPITNTVPFASFGLTVLTDDEVALYISLVNKLILDVHGIDANA